MWLLDVEDDAVEARVARGAERLGTLVTPSPRERLHVTTLVCGFPDELPAGLVAAHRRALAGARAPRIRVLGPAASLVSVHLEVCDCDGGIGSLRRRLEEASAAAGHREPRESSYRPHVTVGDFTGSYPASDVLAPIAALDRNPMPLALPRLRLVALDTRSHHLPYVEVVEELRLS